MLWRIIGGLVIILGGGGYFAYSKGYISLPFISPKSDALFGTMVDSISKIKNAQYSVRVNLKAEPRSAKATPIFVPSTNTSAQNANTTLKNTPVNTSSSISPVTVFSIESIGSTIGLGEPDYGNSYLGGLMGLARFDELFSAIPGDIDFSGGVSLFVEADKKIKEANGFVKLDGTYKGGDISVDVDLEARKIGQELYGVVNKFPSFFLLDASAIKEKWVHLTSDESNSWLDETVYDEFETKEAIETLKLSLGNALKYQVFTVKRKLGNETIAGVNSQHYEIRIDVDQFPKLYQGIIDEKKSKNENVDEFVKIQKSLENPEVMATLKRIADNSSIEIWVDKVNGYLRQTKWSIMIVPPSGNEKLAGKQFRLEFVVTMEKVNQNVTVEKPSIHIDLDEATRLMSGISKEEQQFDKQRSRLNTLQRVLETYITAAGQSPDRLSELWPKFAALDAACKQRDEQRQVNANSSTNTAYDYEKDYNCYSYPRYTEQKVSVIDVYSGQPYVYAKNGATDFTISYSITLPTSSSYSSYATEYVNGKNTMTRDDVSLEMKSPSDATTTTNISAPTNTSINTNTTSTTNAFTNSALIPVDTDGDGIEDDAEQSLYNSNPSKKDSDDDGVHDLTEVLCGTKADVADSDADGHNDYTEITNGYNPLGAGQALTTTCKIYLDAQP